MYADSDRIDRGKQRRVILRACAALGCAFLMGMVCALGLLALACLVVTHTL